MRPLFFELLHVQNKSNPINGGVLEVEKWVFFGVLFGGGGGGGGYFRLVFSPCFYCSDYNLDSLYLNLI